MIWALINLGTAARYRGDLGAAELLLRQGLDLGEELNFREGIAWATNQLGVRRPAARGLRAGARACSRPASPSTVSSATGGERPASTTSSPPWRWPPAMRCGPPVNWPLPIGSASEIDAPVPAVEQADRTRTVEAARQQLGSVFEAAGLTADL